MHKIINPVKIEDRTFTFWPDQMDFLNTAYKLLYVSNSVQITILLENEKCQIPSNPLKPENGTVFADINNYNWVNAIIWGQFWKFGVRLKHE